MGRNIPSEHFSTCFSCRHRSLEGELLAGDGQVAEMDQLPRATLRFYEQEPKKQEGMEAWGQEEWKEGRGEGVGEDWLTHFSLSEAMVF